jgi:heavy metal translocating P-type ATPase
MLVEIRHFIPGRIRLHIPDLFRIDDDPERTIKLLCPSDAIHTLRAKNACASLVIEYDRNRPGVISDLLALLRRHTVTRLLLLPGVPRLLEDGTLAPVTDNPPPANPPPANLAPKKWPLIWPTVSLALTFFAGPVIGGINIPLMVWNSVPILRRAWRVLSQERRLNVDFLDVIAITVSIIEANMLTAAIVIWLIRLGDWIRDLTAARSRRAFDQLLEFQRKMAWLVRDGAVIAVPAQSLVTGDIVAVHSGELIPVDGEVLSGHASVDQKTITGESLPVFKVEGDAVYAATALREGYLTIRAARVGAETTAAQIVHLVESAPIGETRMQNHAERFADRLVVPTLALATGMGAVFADINRFTSIVIVDYGTGIRVAAPTSVLASMTHAARQGILIKSGAHLEKLAAADTIVFDKTGTLTSGVPHIHDLICYNERRLNSRKLLGLAASAESRLQHPVAEAIRARTLLDEIEIPDCQEVQYRVGYGVEAQINGHYLHLGSERFLREQGIATEKAGKDRYNLNEAGCSSLFMAVDGKLAALIPYADQIRPESQEVIKALHERGIKNSIMLTGDNSTVARAVAGRLGLTQIQAEMLPAQKADFVQELKRQGKIVAMVGDGINDSPALSYADIGIAMKHGAEVAHESANIVLLEDSLYKLVQAVDICRQGVALIKQNYWIVATMNTAALALALPGGLISPQMTAILSNGSAIVASLNAVRPTLRY